MKNDFKELVFVVVAALAPMWVLAGNLSDGDEMVKSGAGAACCTAVVAVYRLWLRRGAQQEA